MIVIIVIIVIIVLIIIIIINIIVVVVIGSSKPRALMPPPGWLMRGARGSAAEAEKKCGISLVFPSNMWMVVKNVTPNIWGLRRGLDDIRISSKVASDSKINHL